MSEGYASFHGRLVADVRSLGSPEKPMSASCMAVNLPVHGDDEALSVFVDLMAFGRVADLLARHQKGEIVNVSGQVQGKRWTDNQGNEKTGFKLIADAIVSARTTRAPGNRSQAAPNQAGSSQAVFNGVQQAHMAGQLYSPEFNDEIPSL